MLVSIFSVVSDEDLSDGIVRPNKTHRKLKENDKFLDLNMKNMDTFHVGC